MRWSLTFLPILLLGCLHVPPEPSEPSPGQALEALVQASRAGDRTAVEALLTPASLELADRYRELHRRLEATALPADPVTELARQLTLLQPELRETRVQDGRAELLVQYHQGPEAVLIFRADPGGWRYDLAEELVNDVERMEELAELLEEYSKARREGRPVYHPGDDDD